MKNKETVFEEIQYILFGSSTKRTDKNELLNALEKENKIIKKSKNKNIKKNRNILNKDYFKK